MAKQESPQPSKSPRHGQTILAFNTVRFAIIGIALVVVSVVYTSSSAARNLASSVFADTTKSAARPVAGPHQATLTSIHGTVSVRRTGDTHFSAAASGMPLDHGDAVQTEQNGLARIAFADGTQYSVQSNTLVVIQKRP